MVRGAAPRGLRARITADKTKGWVEDRKAGLKAGIKDRRPGMKHAELTEKIIKGFYQVYNTLGSGFLEKVYERALELELQEMGLLVQHQAKIEVYYKGVQVSDYF